MLETLFRTPARLALPLVLLAAPLSAQQAPPSTQQREHVVRTGDTLWDLARAYLNNPFLWPMILEANRGIVENPHRIYPAERLVIPGVPAETLSEPLGAEYLTPTPPVIDTVVVDTVTVVDPVTVSDIDLRRPAVPLSEVIAAPWLSSRGPAEVTARIIRAADPAHEGDQLPTTLYTNERVVLGEVRSGLQPGDSLLIVRYSRRVGAHGVVAQPLGILRVDTVGATTSTARLIRQFGETRVGDVAMPFGALPEIGLGSPAEVGDGVVGQLLEFLDQEPLHGTTDVAFISVGGRDGVRIGDEFAVYVPARAVDNERPERLPETAVATVRVVKVADASATVRVVRVHSAALKDGLPVRLIRRMP